LFGFGDICGIGDHQCLRKDRTVAKIKNEDRATRTPLKPW